MDNVMDNKNKGFDDKIFGKMEYQTVCEKTKNPHGPDAGFPFSVKGMRRRRLGELVYGK